VTVETVEAAVVNIPGVLTCVRDGRMLEVNGDVGKVTLRD
jgi:hypothetical protein